MRKWMWSCAVIGAAAGPAGAFYFPGWPADGLVRPVTLFGSEPGAGPGGIQTEDVYIRPPFPRPPLPPLPPPDGPTPQTVPEPASFALAAIGLGAVAVRRMQNVEGKMQK